MIRKQYARSNSESTKLKNVSNFFFGFSYFSFLERSFPSGSTQVGARIPYMTTQPEGTSTLETSGTPIRPFFSIRKKSKLIQHDLLHTKKNYNQPNPAKKFSDSLTSFCRLWSMNTHNEIQLTTYNTQI